MAEPTSIDADHRSLGVALFNNTWMLLEKLDRTEDESSPSASQTTRIASTSARRWPRCRS
jgi:hypothetical protein